LGGLGEVGKNMTCIEYGRNVLVIDAGIMFPEAEMWGVDYVLPDWTYLLDKKDLVRAIVITHGHEDHIGGLPYLMESFDAPIYATRLTRGLIEVKLKEKRLLDQVELHTYEPGDEIRVGPFAIEPYHVCHSIPDGVGLGITTPAGLIVHSGDFKFDHTPADGWPTDYAKLVEFSNRGVLLLMSDSTNAEQSGYTSSEAVLDDAFRQMMQQAPGRLIIATFASLISRIQQIADVAREQGRKMAVAGRSMVENVKMARELGYLDIPDDMMVGLNELDRIPPERIVIMATGSQGEPMAVLSRLATGRHRSLQIHDGDTVVFSSHTIPGNEEMTHDVINRLFQQGAEVVYDPISPVHVSGHASQEEQKWLINLIRPRYFVPIHGELRHLKQHAKIAQSAGVPKENVLTIENGYVLEFDQDRFTVEGRVPGGYVMVDGARVGEVGPRVMHERDALGQSGFVTAIARLDRQAGELVGTPRLLTRGFVFMPASEDLMSRAVDVVRSAVVQSARAPTGEIEKRVEELLSRFFYRETRRSPVITAAVIDE
jgi:ribonuclease J